MICGLKALPSFSVKIRFSRNLDGEIETPKTQLVTVVISLAVAVGLNAIAIITTIEKGE